jgi:nitrite reductase (NO-forming)
MYGLILVEPKEGLPAVDHEYYVMQGEFYTVGKFGDAGLQPFDMDKAVDERPPYVVFNGAVGAVTDSNALTAKVGEKIRIFVGNGGPNLNSSFHVIGNIFDTVYADGGTTPSHNIQTVLVPAGGAAIVEFQPKTPGAYGFVDHSIFRAFNKGAMGTLNVTGEANLPIFSGKQNETLFSGEAIAAPALAKEPTPAPQTVAQSNPISSASLADKQMELGKSVYMQTCFVCHQPDGRGVGSQIPPLAGSDFLLGDKSQAIRTVIQGRTGEVIVSGKKFVGTMISFGPSLTDEQIANVLTYARNSWGNKTSAVTPAEVHTVRQGVPALAAKSNSFE